VHTYLFGESSWVVSISAFGDQNINLSQVSQRRTFVRTHIIMHLYTRGKRTLFECETVVTVPIVHGWISKLRVLRVRYPTDLEILRAPWVSTPCSEIAIIAKDPNANWCTYIEIRYFISVYDAIYPYGACSIVFRRSLCP